MPIFGKSNIILLFFLHQHKTSSFNPFGAISGFFLLFIILTPKVMNIFHLIWFIWTVKRQDWHSINKWVNQIEWCTTTRAKESFQWKIAINFNFISDQHPLVSNTTCFLFWKKNNDVGSACQLNYLNWTLYHWCGVMMRHIV